MDIQEILKKVERTTIKASELRSDDKIPMGDEGKFLRVWTARLENGMVRADMEDGTYAEFPVEGKVNLINRTHGPLGLSLEEMGHWAVALDVPMHHSMWSRDAGHNAVHVHDFARSDAQYDLFDVVLQRWPIENLSHRVDLTKDYKGWWVTLWGRGEPEANGVVKTRFYGDTVAEACLKALAARAIQKQ
jgi:hypothetical protein